MFGHIKVNIWDNMEDGENNPGFSFFICDRKSMRNNPFSSKNNGEYFHIMYNKSAKNEGYGFRERKEKI